MIRSLTLLSTAAALAATAAAQCPTGANAPIVKWSSTSGYAATFDADDEGITNPPIDLTVMGGFPMPSAAGAVVYDRMWVNSNGEVYLDTIAAANTAPVGGAQFGCNLLSEFQGPAGGMPRVVCLGGDHESADVAGANWSCTVEQIAGQVTVTWIDMARFANVTDKFSFQMVLSSTGTATFNYGTTFPVGLTGRWIGISIGNLETSTAGSTPMTGLPVSPLTQSILYETVANFDTYVGKTVTIVPDFTIGNETYACMSVVPYVPPPCASNVAYGTGCHTYVGPDTENLFQLFADHPAAKAALDGNALRFTLGVGGYTATWLPGAAAGLYVAPSLGATIVANVSTGTESFSPSAPIPIPGGFAPTWTLSSEGILTAAATGNQTTDTTPALVDTNSATVGTELAFYTWFSQNPTETGSGKYKREEVGGVLYVTAEGVEAVGTSPTLAPSTYQWQINMTTGEVTMVWTSMSIASSTGDVLVGCTLAGNGFTPVSVNLSTATPFPMADQVTMNPMTLAAAPAPVINPSTLVTYTASTVPEFVPGSGVYIGTMFLSVNPNPGGFDLAGILTTVPGCNAWIVTLDVDLGGVLNLAPTLSWNFNFSTPVFAPGNVVAAQAVALFDPAFPLPNGEAGGFITSNGVLSTTQLQ